MSGNVAVNNRLSGTLIDFQQLISERTGLFYSERKWNMLNSAINEFCREHKNMDMFSAFKMLDSHVTESDLWKNFISKLTINETFFFRHFQGIEDKLLPQLVKQKSPTKNLRIWSAGCSSGEEPYSIAMVLKKIIPDIEQWKIHILATDIDSSILKQARKGVYREWSMRQIQPFYLNNYFNKKGSEYTLDPSIRKLVHFEYLNLKDGNFPSASNGTTDIDLIFCRNVTIYFEAQETIKIARKFFDALIKGGKLIVGHSEPSTFIYDQYRSEILDDIVIYNKDLDHLSKTKPVRKIIEPPEDRRSQIRRKKNGLRIIEEKKPKSKSEKEKRVEERRKTPNIFEMHRQAIELMEGNRLEESVKILDKLLVLNQKNADLYFITAYVRAKMGKFEVADTLCRKSLQLNDKSEDTLLLLSIISREQWHLDEAKRYSKRLILKNSNYLPAFLELLQIAHMEENKIEQKRLAKKISLLSGKLDPQKKYAILEGMTVEQIKNMVKVMVQE